MALVFRYAHAPLEDDGFRLTHVTDDPIHLVSRHPDVTTLPSLALRAHRNPEIHTTEIPGAERRIYTATYGDQPDPPAAGALIEAIQKAATAPKSQERLPS